MAIACVTGASRGIGRTITQTLAERGWTVCALARSFDDPFIIDAIHEISCDLTDSDQLEGACRAVLAVGPVGLLVNNAGMGVFGPHETLSANDLKAMIDLNLTAPMLMTKHLLRSLRESKGHVVNIASTAGTEAKRFGCAYGATKAGLIHFGHSLFDEVRKQGVRVTTICPDMTRTDFHDTADFEPDAAEDCALLPTDVAQAVLYAIDQPERLSVNDFVVRPRTVGIKKK